MRFEISYPQEQEMSFRCAAARNCSSEINIGDAGGK